jgi:hypothetical protein
MATHACNPNYSAGGHQEDQKVSETPILISKPGVVAYACDLSYTGGHR